MGKCGLHQRSLGEDTKTTAPGWPRLDDPPCRIVRFDGLREKLLCRPSTAGVAGDALSIGWAGVLKGRAEPAVKTFSSFGRIKNPPYYCAPSGTRHFRPLQGGRGSTVAANPFELVASGDEPLLPRGFRVASYIVEDFFTWQDFTLFPRGSFAVYNKRP